jgi:hypothetical protein
MQASQKAQFKVMAAQSRMSKRFPADGWSQEMFEKDYACHAKRMLNIRKHVDTAPPLTITHPPPWLAGKKLAQQKTDAERERFLHGGRSPARRKGSAGGSVSTAPWIFSESRNSSNIVNQRDFAMAKKKKKKKKQGKGSKRGDGDPSGVGVSAVSMASSVDMSRGRIRPSTAPAQRRTPGPVPRGTAAAAAAAAAAAGAASAAAPSTSSSARRSARRADASISAILPHPDAPSYALDGPQRAAYDAFTDVLAQFDTFAMLDMLEDALHDAQGKTGLADYFGADEEL